MTRNTGRVLAAVFIGTFLLQSAWILTIPPFRGLDEFDHAYRATAVANGEWLPEAVSPERGRGTLVTATRNIVEAAEPECSRLPYTGRDNCNPVSEAGDGLVTVGSGAGRYHPAFYWVIGKSAAAFEGANALYVMRLVAALLCAGFVTLAVSNLRGWSRTRWPAIALLVSMTPVLLYTTAVAAPNGIEITAGLALWTALLGVTRVDLSSGVVRQLLWTTLPSGVVLTTVRSMGPMWLGLVVLTVVAILGFQSTLELVRRNRLQLFTVTCVLVTATLASVWWVLSAGTLAPEDAGGPFDDPLRNTAILSFLWILQAIAAFPARDESAPAIVYACHMLVIATVVGSGLLAASKHLRKVILAIIAVSFLVPFTLTLMTYTTAGSIWQGRYGLPYSVGVLLVAGLALDRARFRHRLVGPALLGGLLALLVAHTVSVVAVLLGQLETSPSVGSGSWLMPEPWHVAALTVAGLTAWAYAVWRSSPDSAAGVPVFRDELDGKLLEEQTHVRDDAPRL